MDLIKRGAWRGPREAQGKRPIDIAKRRGHGHLLGVLEPPDKFGLTEATPATIQQRRTP